MITIKEIISGRESYYQIRQNFENQTLTTVVRFTVRHTKTSEGRPYILFYDSKWDVMTDVCDFLNNGCSGNAINTQIKFAEAMKILCAYEEISGKQIEEFERNDVTQLITFIQGLPRSGTTTKYELLTKRESATVNDYLTVFRKYLTHKGITEHYLLRKRIVKSIGSPNDIPSDIVVESYESNLVQPDNKQNIISYYIRESEYKDMITLINKEDNNYTIRDEIIIRFMFQYGLRIGEVLGLTTEDIKNEPFTDKNTGEQRMYAYVEIRNRVSDKKYQRAKRCMQVFDREQYKMKDYNQFNYGFQVVPIHQDFYKLIKQYEETTMSLPNYANSEADSIHPIIVKGKIYSDNHYIFLNNKGDTLSQARWNQILRDIFTETGVLLDTGGRCHNLNHRFRHGFAMWIKSNYLAKYGCEIDRSVLKDRMRHSSESSVEPYFKKTLSEIITMKTDFNTEMIDPLVPFLNEPDWLPKFEENSVNAAD